MNNITNFSIVSNHCCLDISPFNTQQIFDFKSLIFNNVILNDFLSFESLCEISFNDDMHKEWNINLTNEFNKRTINGILFYVNYDPSQNPSQKKYLLIFQNITKNDKSYGYMWIKENMIGQPTFALEYVTDAVIRSIVKDHYSTIKQNLYKVRSKIPTIKEYEEAYKYYIETYRYISYDKWKELSKKYNCKYRVGYTY